MLKPFSLAIMSTPVSHGNFSYIYSSFDVYVPSFCRNLHFLHLAQCFLRIPKQRTSVQIACLLGIPDNTALCGNLCELPPLPCENSGCVLKWSVEKSKWQINEKPSSLSINCVKVLLTTTLVVVTARAKLSLLLMKDNGECVVKWPSGAEESTKWEFSENV